jgi:hypothetical protein
MPRMDEKTTGAKAPVAGLEMVGELRLRRECAGTQKAGLVALQPAFHLGCNGQQALIVTLAGCQHQADRAVGRSQR